MYYFAENLLIFVNLTLFDSLSVYGKSSFNSKIKKMNYCFSPSQCSQINKNLFYFI